MTSIFDFAELVKPATAEEVVAKYYQILGAIGVTTTQWAPGAVVRTYITGTSILVSALSEVMALIARSGFLEFSEGDWLTQVAHYVYGVDRIAATFATGKVTLTNTGGGLYSLGAGDLIVINPTTNKTYRNQGAFTLNPMTTVSDIAIEATEAGADSTSAAGTITGLVTTLLGVTVTNPSAVVGQDTEADPSVRDRCYTKLGSLSPFGPWDAYRYAATNATRADGSNCGVTRTQNDRDGYGNQWTYVATDAGGVPGTVGDLDTDLGCVDDAIQRKAAPLCVTAYTVAATEVGIGVTYECWMYNTASYTPAQAVAIINDALTDFFAGLPIGGAVITPGSNGYVYRDAIIAAIDAAIPEIFHVVVTVPSADVALAIGEVAVSNPPSGTVHPVPPTEGFGG